MSSNVSNEQNGVQGSALLEAALRYARLGYRVIPLHEPTGSMSDAGCTCGDPECGRAVGKHPRVGAWQKKATADQTTIQGWWAKWPTANVGIAAGNGLAILDVDADGALTLQTQYGLDVEAVSQTTPSARTGGGGWHLFFEEPPGLSLRNSVRALGNGLDVRAMGGQVAAAPSLHRSGGVYRWVTPLEVPRAPWPTALLAQPEGGRDAWLTSQVGYWFSLGKSDAEVLDLATAWNAEHGAPPMRDAQVSKIVRSIAKAREKNGPAGIAFDVIYSDVGNGRRLATATAQELKFCPPLDRWVAWNSHHWEWDTRRELLARQRAKGFVDDEFRAATDAKIAGTRSNADEHVRALLGLYNEKRFSPMLKNAKDDPIVRIAASAFDRQPSLLNVADGTLDLDTLTLRAYDKHDLLTGALAVPYEAGALSEAWAQHIRYLAAASDGTARPELEAFYWRALGYTLLGNNPERVLFFLKGRTTAGKSVLQEGIRALFGRYSGALSFHSLLKPGKLRGGGDTTRPDLVQLLGKRFVTAGEPNPDGEFDVALIKQLTGGDALKFRTLYAEPVEFVFGGKLWLAANNPPKIEADDEAIWRRILVLPVEYTIPDRLRDDTILPKLTSMEAKTGLLAMMIRGLGEWRALGGLKPPAMVKHATVTYRDENDIVRHFLEQCCIVDPEAKTRLAWVFDRLNSFCDEREIPRPCSTSRQLKERLQALAPSVVIRPGGKNIVLCYGLGFDQGAPVAGEAFV